MESPIGNLVTVLRITKESAISYGDQLSSNEAATRAVLIDPVLRALGWDIANPSIVEIEKTRTVNGGQQLKVDYALLSDGEIIIIVEAKKLGGDLKKDFFQVVNYSFGCMVPSVFLTDGIHWQHFCDLTPQNQQPKRELNIESDPLEMIAAYLVENLDAALFAPEPVKIDELSTKIEQLDQKISNLETLCNEVRQSSMIAATAENSMVTHATPIISTTQPDMWRPLSENLDAKGTKPSNFRLPNGVETAVKTWAHVWLKLVDMPLLCTQNCQFH